MTTAVIDLAPVINQVVLPLAATAATALLGWTLAKIAAYFHIQMQDSQRALVAQAIDSGIAFAKGQLGKISTTVTVDDHVAAAVNYVLPKVPDALKSLGVTPDHLGEIIAAKLA